MEKFVSFYTGNDKPRSSALKPGFYNFECDCLDAPILVASGSICSVRILQYVYFGQQAYRHYRDVYELWS